jgi:RNA polymerase sigma factor (sigma-70 family)
MQELDDISLLREYVNHEAEDAFAALVARHVNKVYSIALRHARNRHQAEEITQAVFVVLARKARRLDGQVILAGWLCRTAQLTAVTFVRSETRRARREQEAYMQNSLVETGSEVWPQIEPLLDAAMAGLSKADHDALVLRFFDGKSMREVGAALGASEDAAKMRVNRAVEKLRLFFSRRGIAVSVAILTAAISANSVQAAPATLAKTATTLALAKGATASTSTSTLIKGVLKIMAWTKAKTAIVAGAVTLLLAGTATVVVKNRSQPIPASAQPLTARSHPEAPGPHDALVLPDVGQGHPVPEHSPNAQFANLTPEQRVEQARRHYPQSLDDLNK